MSRIVTDGVDPAAPSDLLEVLSGGDPPAFATDQRHRILFWNEGATRVLGFEGKAVLGRACYEVLGGRDGFGNRFCYEHCPVVATVRSGERAAAFEIAVPAASGEVRTIEVTTSQLPSDRPGGFTLVHVFRAVEAPARTATPKEPPLTQRETEILRRVAAGLQNKEIAQELAISLATVRNHVHNVLEKLGVHSKLEAVSLAFRSGWVEEGPVTSRQP